MMELGDANPYDHMQNVLYKWKYLKSMKRIALKNDSSLRYLFTRSYIVLAKLRTSEFKNTHMVASVQVLYTGASRNKASPYKTGCEKMENYQLT